MINIDQGFFEFVKSLPAEEWIVSGFFMWAGAILHWVKKAAVKEAPWNIWEYCIKQYPGRTVGLVLAIAGAQVGLMTTGFSTTMTWPAFILASFQTGFMANSLLNKGDPPTEAKDKK